MDEWTGKKRLAIGVAGSTERYRRALQRKTATVDAKQFVAIQPGTEVKPKTALRIVVKTTAKEHPRSKLIDGTGKGILGRAGGQRAAAIHLDEPITILYCGQQRDDFRPQAVVNARSVAETPRLNQAISRSSLGIRTDNGPE